MDVHQEQLNPDGVRGHIAATTAAVHRILHHIGATEPDLANAIRVTLVGIQERGMLNANDGVAEPYN